MRRRCAVCKRWFELSNRQTRGFREGKRLFACSESCKNQLCALARKTHGGGRPNLGKTDLKMLTRVRTRYAIATGRLRRPKRCQECGKNPGTKKNGDVRVEAHHVDYSDHLNVRWLCDACHRKTIVRVRGEQVSLAKLTETDVRYIRSVPARYGYRVALSKRFGVDRATIDRARSGATWRHVL